MEKQETSALPAMEMIVLSSAESSTVARMTYDGGLRLLTAEFRKPTKAGTSVYQYAEVSALEWSECSAAERPGTWLLHNVIRPKRTTIPQRAVTWCRTCEDWAPSSHQSHWQERPFAIVRGLDDGA